jgi:hypothetical protein
MFGGLEIKAQGSKEDEPAASAPPGGSAFGFMHTAAPAAPSEPAAAEPTPATSAFSFLHGGAEPAAAPPAPAATSAFSFLQETTVSAPAPVPEPAPEPPASSGFSFLIPSPSNGTLSLEQTPPQPEPETVADAPAALPSASSAFSFLSSAIPDPEPVVPPAAPPAPIVSTTSSVTSTPAPAPLNVLEAPASAPSGPTGAGITFGTASAPRTVRKKKSRAQKVGMGAAVSSAPTPAAAAAPPPPAAPKLESSQQSARDAAADAARRAEEFMQKKSLVHSKEAENSSSPPVSIPTYDEAPAIMPTASTDDVVATAQAAAEEARTMSQHQTQPKGFMGTFFKGFGGSSSSLGNNGPKGRRPSPTPSTNTTASNHVDPLAKKQEDMKRAMAEREIQMQQQALGDKDDDGDNNVVVSTSVGGYQPEAYQPEAIVTTAAIIETPATSSVQPTFEPAKPKVPTYVVREISAKPRKKKTAKDTFEEYQALFAQSVHRAMEQVENVGSQQKMLLEDRFISLAKQSLATQQIAQTELQLQVAVEEEEYELADQLGQVIEAHKREKHEVAMFLDSIAAGLAQLDSQKSLVVKGVASCFENLTVRLTELQEKEGTPQQSNDSEKLRMFGLISKQLSAEQERLQREYKAIELDEERAAEERKELENAISQQSGEFQKQQDSVKTQLSETEIEIEELRKQLDEKQQIAAGLRKDMYGLEDSISKVRVKFTRQLNRVDKKERSVRENRIEWQTEQATFQKQKEANELQVKTHSENLLAHDELVKTLEDELKLAKEFAVFVPTKLGILEDPVESEEKDSEAEGDLAELQADVVKSEAAASEAKVLLKAANAVIHNLEKEHSDLVEKIPMLEEMKKAAASKRDFKLAGKASKDIKDSTARLKECEEELVGEAAARKKSAEEELKRLDAELVEARKVAQGKEKISAQRKMRALANKIQTLAATKKELCGDCSSSKNTVRGLGALVLDIQIKALQDEGESLGSKHGGWGELTNGTGGGDAEEKTAAVDTANKEEDAEKASPASEAPLNKERISRARELVKNIQVAEEAVETAAANEKYEEAEELQEKSEKVQAELEGLGLTDSEMEFAFSDQELPSDESEEPPKPGAVEEAVDEAAEEEDADEPSPSGEIEEQDEGKKEEETTESKSGENEGDDQVEVKEEDADENKENADVTTEAVEPTPDSENSEGQQNGSTLKEPAGDEAEKASTEEAPPEAASAEGGAVE